jgi:phospholipid/cholesterol/gamma-HCH transport system substrate-binding protein
MQRKKVIITGIVFFVTLIVFIWGMGYLKGKSIFRKDRSYYAVYNQVNGLNVGSPVTFKGLKVGHIKRIEFSDELGSKIIVVFNVDKDFRIPKGSKAQIFNADIIGTKGLQIIASNSTEYYEIGDTLNSAVEVSMVDDLANNLGPLKNKTESLVEVLDSAIRIINRVIIDNEENLNASMYNIKRITEDFNAVSRSLNGMMNSPDGKIRLIVNDLQAVTAMLKENEPQLSNAIDNFSAISDSLAAANLKYTIEQTNQTLANLNAITAKINSGDGTIGQLIDNDTLYMELEELTRNLDLLVEDLKENPHRYVHFSIIDTHKNKDK